VRTNIVDFSVLLASRRALTREKFEAKSIASFDQRVIVAIPASRLLLS